MSQYVVKPQELKGYGVGVAFEEIHTLESIVTRKPTENYKFFADIVTKHNPKALVQKWPVMVVLFETKEQASNFSIAAKERLESVVVYDEELVFTKEPTKNQEKADA